VTQHLKNAEVRTECFLEDVPFRARAYLSPTRNVLVSRQRVVNRWVSPEIAAHMPANCRGVEFEGSFTSHGTPSTDGGRQGAEDCCMATNAVFAILPIVWKWKYGRDVAFLAETAYPLMRAVADFFDDYIGQPVNGRYEVYGSVHEGADWFTKNDMFSLGAIRFLYREILAASLQVGRDADRRAHWQDILDPMSEYPLQAWGDKVTFRPDAVHDVMFCANTRQPVPVVQDEDEFAFGTTAGFTYEIARAECAAVPPGAPVITVSPTHATVRLTGAATFSVSATGENLRYQWQKNRTDIPGAIHSSYTTPAMTLWDTGSEFRCVVSNDLGTTRSRPGTLSLSMG
jgi:hypothetical protein